MAIDRMDWHYGGDFPEGLPDENGGTHIGLFLAWIINHRLEGEFHQEESTEALEQVRKREITGRTFLIDMCDEKFWEEDLSKEGLAFTNFYYEDNEGGYFSDYQKILSADLPTIYHAEDSWENYDRIAPAITAAYQRWKNTL